MDSDRQDLHRFSPHGDVFERRPVFEEEDESPFVGMLKVEAA
jgi:hypothetical protein